MMIAKRIVRSALLMAGAVATLVQVALAQAVSGAMGGGAMGGGAMSGGAMGGGAMKSDKAAMKDGMMAKDDGAVEYTVVVKSRWTAANFPVEYPPKGLVTGPHHSGLIGASHNASYAIVREGAAPTPGLERLSEEGKHAPLDAEIKAAIAKGSAGMLFESGPLRDFGDSIVTTVKVSGTHPLVDFVMMIAPSPDWFTGATSVDLRENGGWARSRTVEMSAWDSGGDDGETYLAPDKDNVPKKATMKAMNRHFLQGGKPGVIATVTFTRK